MLHFHFSGGRFKETEPQQNVTTAAPQAGMDVVEQTIKEDDRTPIRLSITFRENGV